MTLEADFVTACDAAIEECNVLRYDATAWIAMTHDLGAAEAPRRLVVSGDIQSGFPRLAREGRLDLTIEMAVLHPK
jgi:metallophosphoesterase superfamily enzyme